MRLESSIFVNKAAKKHYNVANVGVLIFPKFGGRVPLLWLALVVSDGALVSFYKSCIHFP